jgi:hypothetical protein
MLIGTHAHFVSALKWECFSQVRTHDHLTAKLFLHDVQRVLLSVAFGVHVTTTST